MTASDSSAPEPVLILGGGLMGLAIAHQLARRGTAVTVLSRRRSEAESRSKRTGATTSPTAGAGNRAGHASAAKGAQPAH